MTHVDGDECLCLRPIGLSDEEVAGFRRLVKEETGVALGGMR